MLTIQRVRKAGGKHVSRARLVALSKLGATASRHCPACNQDVVGFFKYGNTTEWGCISCGSSPRERLMHSLLDLGTLCIPASASVLHCAPNEHRLVERFRGLAGDYVPADIDPHLYDIPGIQKLDLMQFNEQDRFDRVYASHVMEHVPDDAVVLRNIHRALKPDGEAWLLVPLWGKPTEDGPPNLGPRERERRFGQWDHVRQYGPDFAERIQAAGFSVDVIGATQLPAGDMERMALSDHVFRARRTN